MPLHLFIGKEHGPGYSLNARPVRINPTRPLRLQWMTEFYDALKPYLLRSSHIGTPDITLKDYIPPVLWIQFRSTSGG